MPKLFEYFGIIVFFYSNEHEPVHVHGRSGGRESRAELTIENGQVTGIRYTAVRGRRPLARAQLGDFQQLVEHFAPEILEKWIDYFILHRPVQPRKIVRRIK
jgi:Domain of unknown function (DUF4160)